MAYNGHRNWNHWNVALWIANDENLYRLARAYSHTYGKDEAARRLVDLLPAKTPDGAPYSTTAIRAALVDL